MQDFSVLFRFRCLNLLLLFCLVSYSGTPSVPVKEKKGGIATLSCGVENDIIDINLIRRSKNISVCQTDKCSGRIFKKRVCDVIIKDLRFKDAGKYILRFVYKNYPEKTFHLQIHDEVPVKIGEELKLDILLPSADKVEKNSSEGWRKVWRRDHGVWSDRMTDSDGSLTIKEFTASDEGTYRVVDYEGETLIIVTVTESGTESKDKLDTDEEQAKGTEQLSAWVWIVIAGGVLVVLGLTFGSAFAVIRIRQPQNRNEGHNSYQSVSVEQTVQEPTSQNNSNSYVQCTFSANRSPEDAVSISFLTKKAE